jgi:hypothetical protein
MADLRIGHFFAIHDEPSTVMVGKEASPGHGLQHGGYHEPHARYLPCLWMGCHHRALAKVSVTLYFS